MENRSHALIAGIFTLALLALAIVLAIWLGRDKIKRVPYEIATSMPVAGLNLQAAVRYKGIKVGNVTDIDFDERKPGQILMRIEVTPDTPITVSTYATLAYQGVTGIAYVQLDDDGKNPQALVANNDALPRIPLRPGALQNLEQRGMAILTQTEELTKRLNLLLDPQNQQSAIATIQKIGAAAEAWQKVPGQLEPTLVQLPELARQTRKTLGSVQQLAEDASLSALQVGQFTTHLQKPDGTLARMNQSLEQINLSLTSDTLPQIQSLTQEARATLRATRQAADHFQQKPQSLLFGNGKTTAGPGETGFTEQKP